MSKGIDYRLITPPHHIIGPLWHSPHREWETWLEICRYTGWDPLGRLKPILYRGFVFPYNPAVGVGVKIYDEWRKRITAKKPIRIAIVGEAGSGKSYLSIQIARVLSGRYLNSKGVWVDRFKVEQIPFIPYDYVWLQDNLDDGDIIIPEEPAYVFAAREWAKREQKTTIQVVETSRYKNNPLIFPVVNKNLLDKILREYYINYSIIMRNRGVGIVYRHWWNQLAGTMGQVRVGKIFSYWPGVELARCGMKTCLGCKEITRKDEKGHTKYSGDCEKYIWPQYEKRRDAILSKRREDAFAILTADATEEKKSPKIVTDMRHAIKNPRPNYRNGKPDIVLVMDNYECNRADGYIIIKALKGENPDGLPPLEK